MLTRRLTPAALVLATILRAVPASADVACPTAQTWDDTLWKFYGFTPLSNRRYDYYLGMVDFYGTRIVAVCIHDYTAAQQTLYAVTDVNNNLLPHLTAARNHLCLSDDPTISETTYVHESNVNRCGVTMYPLDYRGRFLVQYGRSGSEHLHGGAGNDWLYGGPGNDNIADYTNDSNTRLYVGEIYGESGDDRLYGGKGVTIILGGPGVDALIDYGGRDALYGEGDNDCCIFNAEPNMLSPIDCGAGTGDVVRSLYTSSPTTNCEVQSSLCGPLPFSCPWF